MPWLRKGVDLSMPELKPCPFCGSTKLKIESKRTFNYSKRHCSVTVRCMKCYARSPVVGINLDKNQHNEHELCESQVTELGTGGKTMDKLIDGLAMLRFSISEQVENFGKISQKKYRIMTYLLLMKF